MTRKQIETAAERAGWNCTIKQKSNNKTWSVNFNTDTTHGQDVQYDYEVKTLDKIVDEIYATLQGYDPDEEAKLWYGADRGEPSSLRDILDDMEEVKDSLHKLYLALSGQILPEEKQVSFDEKATQLRTECLTALVSFSHNAKPSKLGYDATGFTNLDQYSRYREIIFLNFKWVLLDDDGQIYDVNCMPLEEFCVMVDEILKRKD